jgi:hypothetical protein
MSSTGFAPPDGTAVELPSLLLGEIVTLLLIVAAAVALEAALALHPAAPAGPVIVVATFLLAWQRRAVRRRPQALAFRDAGAAGTRVGGSSIRLADARWEPMSFGRESRRLGPSLVLHWQAPGRSGMLWLTACDVPRHELRRWAIRASTGAGR